MTEDILWKHISALYAKEAPEIRKYTREELEKTPEYQMMLEAMEDYKQQPAVPSVYKAAEKEQNDTLEGIAQPAAEAVAQLFNNNFDCYAEAITGEGSFEDFPAMSKERFIQLFLAQTKGGSHA